MLLIFLILVLILLLNYRLIAFKIACLFTYPKVINDELEAKYSDLF